MTFFIINKPLLKKIYKTNLATMKQTRLFIYALLLLLFSTTASYAQPANDNCATATPITNVSNFCSTNAAGTLVAATPSGFGAAGCWSAGTINDVWYSFVATASDVTIRIVGNEAGNVGGTLVRPQVALYSGSCTGTITELACGTAAAGVNFAQLYKAGLTIGQTYLIRVDGVNNNVGTFRYCIDNYAPVPLPDGDCPTAVVLCSKSSFVVPAVTGPGFNALEMDDATCFGSLFVESNSSWYVFTAGSSGTITFTLTPNNPTDDLDFAIYRLPNGVGNCAGKVLVRCEAASCAGSTGLNTTATDISEDSGCALGQDNFLQQLTVTAGQVYAIAINNFSAAGNGFNFSFGGTATFQGPTAVINDNDANDIICVGQPITFTDASTAQTGGTLVAWAWNFGVGASLVSSTAQNPPAITYSSPGIKTISLTIETNRGCLITKTKTITVGQVLGTVAVTDSVSCFGGNDGKAQATITVGAAPLVYTWTNTANTGLVTNLTAGVHTVTVSDATGCSITGSVTIAEPNVLALTTSVSAANCTGVGGGNVNVTVTGGTTPYHYFWNNFITTPNQNNLPTGNYTVTVTDVNGCSKTATVAVVNTTPLNLFAVVVDSVRCFGGSTGSAQATASGGATPYTYTWDIGTGNPNVALNAGIHTVTVTDANNCSKTATVNILQPNAIGVTTSILRNVSCFGGNNGGSLATGTGGTTPYNYTWDIGTGNPNNSLTAGTHTVTITDVHGCNTTSTVLITQPNGMTITVAQTDSVSCFGGNDGKAHLTVTDGTAPYIYNWSAFANNLTDPTSLYAGLITVTVTDNNGCSQTASTTILQPLQLTANIDAAQTINVSCNGGNNGGACVVASNGTAPYRYIWDNGSATNCATGLLAGVHFVTITDVNNCTTTASVAISQSALLIANATMADSVRCNGASDGSALATATGGTAPYTYIWDMGTGNPNNALNAGTHTVTVTDANSCNTSTQVFIREPNILAITAIMVDSVKCKGEANGKARVNTITGGTPPYRYAWNIGLPTQTNPTLPAGTHTVTVTDLHNCTATATVIILQPDFLTATTVAVQGVTCINNIDGQAVVTAAGGTQPYRYIWSNGNVNPNPINLPGGTQTVTVTDVHACMVSATVIIPVASSLTVNITNPTPVTCNGGANGTATAVPNGGTPVAGANPYTYSWDNGAAGAAATATSLNAGLHTVVVTDGNGCNANSTILITEPGIFSAAASTIDSVSCATGNDGKATVVATGGTAPYTYSWDNFSILQNPTNLNAGTHIVTVTDASGICAATASTIVYEPIVLVVTVLQTDSVSCFGGNDGKAQVNLSGGTPPFSFVWELTTFSGSSPVNLTAGTHSVTVTDGNGCFANATVNINEPFALNATITNFTDASCFGKKDGSATVIAFGGTEPYRYLWSDLDGQTTPVAIGLLAGDYTVTVTDVNNCITSAIVTIAQPTDLTATLTPTNVNCYAGFSGSILATPAGGTPGYTYQWSDSNGQATAVAISLPRGVYTVTITDSHNCKLIKTETITEPPQLFANTSVTNVTCNGSTGIINSNPTGGVGPYTYNWNVPPHNGGTIAPVPSGVYSVTVTDANLCSATATAQVFEPSPIVINYRDTASVHHVYCNGGATGSITPIITGGTQPYAAFIWNDLSAQITQQASNLIAGTYIMQVTDANGCTASASYTVTEPSAIDFSISQQAVKCFGGNDGTATVIAGGGAGFYSYNWSTALPQTNQTATGLTAGIYSVTITDLYRCAITAQVDVLTNTPISLAIRADSVRCNGENSGSLTVTATGGFIGNLGGYAYNWSLTGQTTPTATNLLAGTYSVVVTDANNCTSIGTGIVEQYDALFLSVSAKPVKCFGDNTGSAIVNVLGGTQGYRYAWNGGLVRNSDTLKNVAAGTYIVTVTDRNGCTKTASVIIYQPNQLAGHLAPFGMTEPTCKGFNNGKLEIYAEGGTSPYTFLWNTPPPNNQGATATGLSAGNYQCTITDANGCTSVFTGAVTQPATSVSANATATETSCFGGNDGTATVVPVGGTIDATHSYTYLWSNGAPRIFATVQNLPAGIHTVTVTDIRGCTAMTTVLVKQPARIDIVFPAKTAPTCRDGRDGTATALAGGGTPNYNYTWNTIPTATGAVVSGLVGDNTYTVTATDTKGCTASASVNIGNPLGLVLTLTSQSASCFGATTGFANVVANGGTPVYSYYWSDASHQITPRASGLSAGTYYVTVTDQNGCSAATSTTILQSATLNLRTTANAVSCSGDNNGSATVIATGGTPLYTYNWSPGISNSAIHQGLTAGVYNVTVTDQNNCSGVTTVLITEPPALAMTINSNDVQCYGSRDGRINITATGGTIPYRYSYNNGISFSGNSGLIGIQSGNYTVIVKDKNNCTVQGSTFIDEPQELLVDAGSDQQIEYGDEVKLTATTSSTNLAGVLWTSTPTDETVLVPTTLEIFGHPTADTYYKITVTDLNGCKASDNVHVTVESPRRVFVANAFTPNNDKTNDVLFVQGGKGSERVVYFRVYDRWGELVYEATDAAINDPKAGWDGMLNGQPMDPNTFIWTALIKFKDGQSLVYKGDAALLR